VQFEGKIFMTLSDGKKPEASEYESTPYMTWVFGQFLMIPIAAFMYGVEMLVRSIQGMQQVTNQGIEVMVGPNTFPGRAGAASGPAENPASDFTNSNINAAKNPTINEEEKTLNENAKYCNPTQDYCDPQDEGQCLILWRYKVLYIKRDLEHAFAEEEDLISSDVTDITAWKIAEFIQQLSGRHIKVPTSWIKGRKGPLEYWRIGKQQEAPASYDEALDAYEDHEHVWLVGLPEDDKRYLRLYSQELARYTREKARYKEEQIEVLKEIRDNLAHRSLPREQPKQTKP
jgi:hypothetical protein